MTKDELRVYLTGIGLCILVLILMCGGLVLGQVAAPPKNPDKLISRHFPTSMETDFPISLVSYDSAFVPRSAAHYRAVALVVQRELGLSYKEMLIGIRLVFVPESLLARLAKRNPDVFEEPVRVVEGQKLTVAGCWITPALIFVQSTMEADDTFMHEYMHGLYAHGFIFQDVESEEVHARIYMNENLMLGSDAYLDLIQREK